MRLTIQVVATCMLLAGAVPPAVAQQDKFPLAAPAGVDSNARRVAPPGAVNQGPYDMGTWKYGNAFNPPAGAKIWNPAKIKLMEGGKLVGGTVRGVRDPSTYCAMANAGYDFIWTEMQHEPSTWRDVVNAWMTCPHAKAVPGVRIAYTDEREIQRALDGGALVLVVPTVDTVEEARLAVQWAYFPPLGKRSQGGGPAFDPAMWGRVPGGYRNTINDNLVLILMIETLEGLKNADEIAKVPGVHAIFAASGDLGNFSGYRAGRPGLRARDQHRARRRDQGRQEALRSVRLARPPGLHLLPGAGTRLPRSRAAPAPSWATCTTRRRSRKSDRTRRSDGRRHMRTILWIAGILGLAALFALTRFGPGGCPGPENAGHLRRRRRRRECDAVRVAGGRLGADRYRQSGPRGRGRGTPNASWPRSRTPV